MDRYEIFEVNLGKNEFICFELFEVSVLNFSLKEEIMRNIHVQHVAKLSHYIIVFYTQELGTCFGNVCRSQVPALAIYTGVRYLLWLYMQELGTCFGDIRRSQVPALALYAGVRYLLWRYMQELDTCFGDICGSQVPALAIYAGVRYLLWRYMQELGTCFGDIRRSQVPALAIYAGVRYLLWRYMQELGTCFGDIRRSQIPALVIYARVRYLLWQYRNFTLGFIFLGLLKPSFLHLIQNQVGNQVTLLLFVALNFISLKFLAFEKRKDFVLSSPN